MDIKELEIKLQKFKETCQSNKYITGHFTYEEIFPKTKPAAFIVKAIAVKETWKNSPNNYLTNIIDLLKKNTTRPILQKIHVLIINDIDDKKASMVYVINPYLDAKQIKNLYYDSNFRIKRQIYRYLNTGRLNEKQVGDLVNIDDKEGIIDLLAIRSKKDEEFTKIAFLFPKLKLKILSIKL
jgi:hypothetical protein